MPQKLDPALVEWMREARTLRLMDVLVKDGGDARFVGGAVRNTLLGQPVKDIDIATPLLPDEVMRRLKAAKIGSVPTGIEHGTITAVVDGKPFEVTTLRRDVATDGRRAVVAYTTDWREDAARRDFTINALYASADGDIFDFHHGLTDLALGHVRFIGNAVERIREDYLRILRLFRFHAWYGKDEIDKPALNAVSAEKAGLAKLSGERIQQEFFRLLEAANPVPVLRVMAATGILTEILPSELDIARLEHLCAIDEASFLARDPVLRLAALLFGNASAAMTIADLFKLSNKDRTRLEDLVTAKEKIVSYLSIREVRKLLYRLGCGRFKDRVFLHWAHDPKSSNAVQWHALLALADAWQKPNFPLTGREVMMAGVPEGPLVGHILAEVEEWWIDNDFIEDEFSLVERLKAVVQAVSP